MNKRTVTEADFRMIQYRDAKPEDYEFHELDGLVRKDRWEKTVRRIAGLMGYETEHGFDLDCLIYSVECLVKNAKEEGVPVYACDELPD